jgi:hypothetical protein
LVTFCVGTALYKALLKEIKREGWKWRKARKKT